MNDAGDSTLATPTADAAADVEPPERLSVGIIVEAGDWSPFAGAERAIQTAAAVLAGHPECRSAQSAEACVVLADDALVRTLNRNYRGKDRATNVLSFPFQVPPGADCSAILGDVVLAAETVAREAAERGIAPVHHLQHLVIHGLLHLLGFEHENDLQAGNMERIETEILATLGIADPYATAEPE